MAVVATRTPGARKLAIPGDRVTRSIGAHPSALIAILHFRSSVLQRPVSDTDPVAGRHSVALASSRRVSHNFAAPYHAQSSLKRDHATTEALPTRSAWPSAKPCQPTFVTTGPMPRWHRGSLAGSARRFEHVAWSSATGDPVRLRRLSTLERVSVTQTIDKRVMSRSRMLCRLLILFYMFQSSNMANQAH